MADEPDVQSSEITLEDFNADEQDSKTESSTVKEAKAEPDKVLEKPEAKGEEVKAEEPTAEPAETTDTEDPKVEETETEDKPQTKADERKAQLNSEIRDLVAQRNAIKAEVTKANAEVYQPATEDELVDQGLSSTDAKVEALRQQMEVRDYNERVAEAQLTLGSESQRILNDFPIFNPDSGDVYDKELAEEAAALMEANLIIDPNTKQVIGSNVSPYQLYKTLARASGLSAVKGQIKAQEATEKQLANADANSSATPPQKTKDPLMELWKED